MISEKPCMVEGCDLPKDAPLHRCYWHAQMSQPIEHQVAAARQREAAVPVEDRLSRLDAACWAPGTRWCSGCQSLPPLFYFPPGGSQCRACSSAARHAASIKREYDLTAEEYDALLLLQGGRCAICRQQPRTIRLAVDHDHQTGEVLGLLCQKCNWEGKGGLHDSVHLARNLVHYMEHPPMTGTWTPPQIHKRRPVNGSRREETDPSYLLYDHEPTGAAVLPPVLERVVKRMTVDQLVLSGGRSDPEGGVYWLAYRPAAAEEAPF